MNCIYCGKRLKKDQPDGYYNCNHCGSRFYLEEGKLVDVWRRRSTSTRICVNCQQSLSGGVYTAPWENGNNLDGYIKCPHCGCINFD